MGKIKLKRKINAKNVFGMCLEQYNFSCELLIQISSGLIILNGLYGHPLRSNKKQVKFNQIISTPFRYILVKLKFI